MGYVDAQCTTRFEVARGKSNEINQIFAVVWKYSVAYSLKLCIRYEMRENNVYICSDFDMSHRHLALNTTTKCLCGWWKLILKEELVPVWFALFSRLKVLKSDIKVHFLCFILQEVTLKGCNSFTGDSAVSVFRKWLPPYLIEKLGIHVSRYYGISLSVSLFLSECHLTAAFGWLRRVCLVLRLTPLVFLFIKAL